MNTRGQFAATLRGFTLIELMITVAIVGILAAIAYPSYQESVLKGRRAEGRAALMDLMQQQERYMTQTGGYLAFDSSTANIPFRKTSSAGSSSAYNLTAETCGSLTVRECIVVVATPVRTSSDPKVNILTLSSTGEKGCRQASQPALCWP